MTEADVRLRDLFAADRPAPRDPAFSARVMERLLRRRFVEDVVLLSLASLAGGGALWLFWGPLHAALVTISQGLAPLAGILALVGCGWVILEGRGFPDPAPES